MTSVQSNNSLQDGAASLTGSGTSTSSATSTGSATSGPADQPEVPTGELTIVGGLALAFAVGALTIFRLGDLTLGLQTDELLSAWVTADSLGDAIARAQRFQGNSAVYFVFLWCWRQLFGASELVLRLPSLLAVAFAMREVVRFGRTLGSADLGALAAVLVLGGAGVTQAMTTARPYGFLLLFAILSTRFLWSYCESGRRRYGVAWAVTLALAIAMTPFAATLGVVHAALALAWRDRRPSMVSLAGFAALCGVLVAPLVPQILALSARRESLVIIAPPRPVAIVVVALPWLALVAVAVCAGFGMDRDRLAAQRHDSRLILFTAWAAVPPILLFLAGVVGDSPVFSDRYRSVGLFGGAFLVAALAVSLQRHGRLLAAIAIGLITAFTVQGAEPQSHGWRDAVAQATSVLADEGLTSDEGHVVALNPGLVESEDHSTLSSPEWAAYLSAPLDHYPIGGPVVLLSQNTPTEALAQDRLARLLVHDTIVVIDGPPGHLWRETITDAAIQAGFAVRSDTRHDALTATVLHRP